MSRIYLQLAAAVDNLDRPYLIAQANDAVTGRRLRTRALWPEHHNLGRLWVLAYRRGYPLYGQWLAHHKGEQEVVWD